MILLVLIPVFVLIRLSFVRVMPWRLVSASTLNLAGTFLFVALGVALGDQGDPIANMLIMTVFYFSLVVGEFAASRLPLNERSFARLGHDLLNNSSVGLVMLGIFLLFSLIPVIGLLAGGASISQVIEGTWASYGIQDRADRLIESAYSQGESSGLSSIITALQTQMTGFWYLSIGIVAVKRYRVALFVLALYTAATFVTSGGSRTAVLVPIGLLVLVWFFLQKRRNWTLYFLMAIFAVVSLLILDGMLQGRKGSEATGSLVDRVVRTLRTDFAYGGVGLQFGTTARPANFGTGADYVARLVTMPIPRFLWPSKGIVDPNWEMTEEYRGASLSEVRSVTLFTPLGEALFYFGYLGLFIVPFLYGLTSVALERMYRGSVAFLGLLAQVYIWSFLGMRHTYWNLVGALVTTNFTMLLVLFLAKRIWRPHKRSAARIVKKRSLGPDGA